MKSILFLLLLSALASPADRISGTVKDPQGKALRGVAVSDGVSVVQTDKKGRYAIAADPESRFVFVSTPSGYISGAKNFYRRLGASRRYDFTLDVNPLDDTRHTAIVIADPQISDADEFPGLVENVKTITEEVSGLPSDRYVFGICLGDIVGWNHALYPQYDSIMAAPGIEWRSVIGNHDMTNYGRSFETSTTDYENTYGPVYYSFNVGKVHYVVLNDNFFVGKDWYYIGYLPERQLSWLEKDLALVPTSYKVVVCLHIPTTLREWDRTGWNFNYSQIADLMCNKKALWDILKPYDALILSGHMHMGDNEIISAPEALTDTASSLSFLSEDSLSLPPTPGTSEESNSTSLSDPTLYPGALEEHNITSLGGAWWCGQTCIDGSPSGFKVYDFDSTAVSWRFRGCGQPSTDQFKVYIDDSAYPGQIVVNVYDYDPRWKVEYFEDGVKVCDLERFEGKDPLAMELYKDPSSLKRTWVCALSTQNLLRVPESVLRDRCFSCLTADKGIPTRIDTASCCHPAACDAMPSDTASCCYPAACEIRVTDTFGRSYCFPINP